MPPVEFLSYFGSAEGGAKKFRQFYGTLWQGAIESGALALEHDTEMEDALAQAEVEAKRNGVFEEVRAASEGFLSTFDDEDQVDVVGATLGLIYKGANGADEIHDFICFQRGKIRDLTLAALRKAGVIGEPVFEDGELVWALEDNPEPPRWHIPCYGAWAYTAGRDPRNVSKKLRKQLQERDYAEPVIGAQLEVIETDVLVRGKVERRVALWDLDKDHLLGTLPAAYSDVDLPRGLGVANAFIYDNALIVICEDLGA